MTGAEGQADQRLKDRKRLLCPFGSIGRKDTCETDHTFICHLYTHLVRDHNFRRGPSGEKRYKWLALFDVDDPMKPQISPILCLRCGMGFIDRGEWRYHSKRPRPCTLQKLSADNIEDVFIDFVEKQGRNPGGAPDITKVSLSPQILLGLWGHSEQAVNAMDSIHNLVSGFEDLGEGLRILGLLEDAKHRFLHVISEIQAESAEGISGQAS